MRSVEVIASRFTSNKVPGRLESPSKEESKSKSQSPTQSALSHPALSRVRTRWFPAVQSSIFLWCLPYPPQKCCPDFQLGHPPPQELQDLEKKQKKKHTHKSWGIVSLMGWSFRILENKSNVLSGIETTVKQLKVEAIGVHNKNLLITIKLSSGNDLLLSLIVTFYIPSEFKSKVSSAWGYCLSDRCPQSSYEQGEQRWYIWGNVRALLWIFITISAHLSG